MHVDGMAVVYTDESTIHMYLPIRNSFNHPRGKDVRGIDVHTNGIESPWVLLKRGYTGALHWRSGKHLPRYLDDFCGATRAAK